MSDVEICSDNRILDKKFWINLFYIKHLGLMVLLATFTWRVKVLGSSPDVSSLGNCLANVSVSVKRVEVRG